MVEEASQLTAHDHLAHVTGVLIALNNSLDKPTMTTREQEDRKNALKLLRRRRIFPINNKQPSPNFDYLQSMRSKPIWYIADRPHLRHSFERLLPLLAVKTGDTEKISTLINELGVQSRILSRVATGISSSQGKLEILEGYSKLLCSKARYIAR